MTRYAIGAVVGVLLIAYFGVAQLGQNAARRDALRLRGQVIELARQREEAEAEARAAKERALALSDSLAAVHAETERVRADASRAIVEARRTATEAEARLRATLDAHGLPTTDVNALTAANGAVVAAKDAEIAALDSELAASRDYINELMAALAASEAAADALRQENTALRRQVDAWNRAANPPLLLRAAKEVGKVAIYGGGGYFLGRIGA